MKFRDVVLSLIVFLVIVLGVAWLVQGNDFFMYKVFAPQYESVRRETFENSKAYRQGMIQELQNMRREYIQADDPEEKAALASIILHRASDFDLNQTDVPPDLREFIEQLRAEQNGVEY